MTKYKIVARPHGNNKDGKNTGGVVILIVKADQDANTGGEEVSRVAYDRKESANPYRTFEQQLDHEVRKAKTAAVEMNKLFEAAGTLT